MGCAQLKVTGSGAGTPGPTVKFPGAYDPRDPGILVNMCMFILVLSYSLASWATFIPMYRLRGFHSVRDHQKCLLASATFQAWLAWPDFPLQQLT